MNDPRAWAGFILLGLGILAAAALVTVVVIFVLAVLPILGALA